MSYEREFQRDHLRARAWGVEERIARVTREITPAEHDAMERAQARFDSVGAHTGQRASAPILGETSLEYRKRLLRPVAAAHEEFANTRLDALDSALLSVVENTVYADAIEKAKRNVPPGQLKAVSERDAAGRLVTRFYGDPMAWMQRFAAPGAIGTINRNPPVKS